MHRFPFLGLVVSLMLSLGTLEGWAAPGEQSGFIDVYEVKTDAYHLVLPAPFETQVEEKAETPWGTAGLTMHTSQLGHGTFFIFRDYAFPADKKLSNDRLKQARSLFLRQRKCTAQDVKFPTVWKNADGQPLPQTVFSGSCAAPEEFIVLTALKPPHVYQLQITRSISGQGVTLEDGLHWLIRHIRLSEP